LRPSTQGDDAPPPGSLDVIVCSDRHQFVGALALIRSAVVNARHPQRLSFHLLTGKGESGPLLDSLQRAFPDPVFRYDVKEFRATPVLQRYVRAAQGGLCNVPHRSAAINCSRFYLGETFPELDKVVYLDADIIVQGDLAELDQEATLDRHDLAAVPRTEWGYFIEDALQFRGVDFREPGFNAGVFVTRLRSWRELGVAAPTETWMSQWSEVRETRGEDLFYFGSQAILNLIFREKTQWLSTKWNVCHLGYIRDIPASDLDNAGILHWSCSRKPWKRNGRYKEYWEKYDVRATRTPGRPRPGVREAKSPS